ncbi:MAG: zinc ribbon domain-containing protein [Thermoleophilaceae bacterium]|nr:zinc ribbon domain-containing protein [Thermoleophilaceae bacterium]
MRLAVFGIENDGLNRAVSVLLLCIVVIWLALVWWTYADARRRIEDPMLIGCATLASLIFPFIGTIVYMIVRPPEYLDDVRERALEIAAAQARLQELDPACPYCGFEIEKTFLRCPSCLRRLKEPCRTCGRPLDPRWKICPYCESEIGQVAPSAQQRRRPRRQPTTAGGRTAIDDPTIARAAPPPTGERRPPSRDS